MDRPFRGFSNIQYLRGLQPAASFWGSHLYLCIARAQQGLKFTFARIWILWGLLMPKAWLCKVKKKPATAPSIAGTSHLLLFIPQNPGLTVIFFAAADYMPLRPQTTSAREKLNTAAVALHPSWTMRGSPCMQKVEWLAKAGASYFMWHINAWIHGALVLQAFWNFEMQIKIWGFTPPWRSQRWQEFCQTSTRSMYWVSIMTDKSFPQKQLWGQFWGQA